MYIVAHVPPGMFELVEGMSWFYSEFNRKYLDILLRYTDVIRAQMYGHEHTDSFRILFDKEGKKIWFYNFLITAFLKLEIWLSKKCSLYLP